MSGNRRFEQMLLTPGLSEAPATLIPTSGRPLELEWYHGIKIFLEAAQQSLSHTGDTVAPASALTTQTDRVQESGAALSHSRQHRSPSVWLPGWDAGHTVQPARRDQGTLCELAWPTAEVETEVCVGRATQTAGASSRRGL